MICSHIDSTGKQDCLNSVCEGFTVCVKHSLTIPCTCYKPTGVHTPSCPLFIPEDPINPSHYQGDAVMVFIEQFKLNFCLGNSVKYIARHNNKNKLQDLKKARWYLEREITNLEKGDRS